MDENSVTSLPRLREATVDLAGGVDGRQKGDACWSGLPQSIIHPIRTRCGLPGQAFQLGFHLVLDHKMGELVGLVWWLWATEPSWSVLTDGGGGPEEVLLQGSRWYGTLSRFLPQQRAHAALFVGPVPTLDLPGLVGSPSPMTWVVGGVNGADSSLRGSL